MILAVLGIFRQGMDINMFLDLVRNTFDLLANQRHGKALKYGMEKN